MQNAYRKYGLLILLIFSHWILHSHSSVGKVTRDGLSNFFSQPQFIGLNTAAKEFYLSEDEKMTVALINLVRFQPRVFIKEIIVASDLDTNEKEVSDLLVRLRNQKCTFPLMPAFSLFKASFVHSKDLGSSGKSGHKGSDGKSYSERISQYFSAPTDFQENYYQGSGDPVDVVMKMLLGKGELGVKYRDNILSNDLHYIGLSIQPHRTKCTNAVVDFAKKPVTATSAAYKKRDKTEVYWRDCPTGTKVSTKRKSGGFSFISLFGGRSK